MKNKIGSNSSNSSQDSKITIVKKRDKDVRRKDLINETKKLLSSFKINEA